MELVQAIEERKSIRTFKPDHVSWEIIEGKPYRCHSVDTLKRFHYSPISGVLMEISFKRERSISIS